MKVDFLSMFIHVVEQKSISKVADNMNISQSALSQRIKTMEETLDVQLLERTYKGITPTEFGEVVYKRGKHIIHSYEQMLNDLAEMQNKNRTIHILSSATMYSYVLPCTLYHLKKNYPSYTPQIEVESSHITEEKVTNGFADMGFIIGKPINKNLISKKIFSDKMFLVANNEVSIPNKITLKELYQHPMLMLSKEHKSRQILYHHLKEIGVDTEKLQVLYNLNSSESIKVSVINGYGLAFLPYTAIKKELYNKQLRIIELHDFHFEEHYYLIKKQRPEHTDADTLKVIDYIEKSIIDTIC